MSLKRPLHPFHLVTPSPWPLYASISSFTTVIGGVMYMHRYQNGGLTLAFGLILLTTILGLWWRDVVREATYEGMHTKKVQQGLKMGVMLFIVSEVMFFFAFFWAFFHSSLSPAIEIGSIWPPAGIAVFSPWSFPLLNTILLLTSGITITYAHHALTYGNKPYLRDGLIYTILLASIFTLIQAYEYKTAAFNISDSVYGSVFYLSTGFHGFHVLIGTTFITVCLLRAHHFTTTHHVGFEAAAWYWHFVDVVWLFLFLTVYWWGGA